MCRITGTTEARIIAGPTNRRSHVIIEPNAQTIALIGDIIKSALEIGVTGSTSRAICASHT